jgi:hypothetical protein
VFRRRRGTVGATRQVPLPANSPTTLEFAVARVELGSFVVLAGLPPAGTDVVAMLSDRGCSTSIHAVTDEERHAWTSSACQTAHSADRVDIALVINPFSGTLAPAALLHDIALNWPAARCVVVQDAEFAATSDPDGLEQRHRRVSNPLIERQIALSGCTLLELRSLDWSGSGRSVGWYAEVSLEGLQGVPSVTFATDVAAPFRQEALQLASYRSALARLRQELDERESPVLAEMRAVQAELLARIERDRAFWRMGSRVRKAASLFFAGLTGRVR